MLSARNKFLFFFLACFLAGNIHAQSVSITPKNNSPYSRFAMGDWTSPYFSAAGGMGGLSAAYSSPTHLNILNPASLASLRTTAFEFGLYGKYAQLNGPNQSDDVWSGNLNYFALGFPLKNTLNQALDRKFSDFGLGMSFALLPYTLVGYDLEVSVPIEDGDDTATNTLKGNGGSYRLLWGNAIRYKGLSAGINIGYQFGKTTYNRKVEFDSLRNAFLTEYLDEFSVNGFFWSAGLQYTHFFKKPDKEGTLKPDGRSFTLGFYAQPASSFKTNSNIFYHRDHYLLGVTDTLSLEDEIKGTAELPLEWSAGLMYEQRNKLKLGVEYNRGQWSKYKNDAKTDKESLSDSWRFAAGLEYIPNFASYNKYYQRMRYRIGFFHGKDPRVVNGEQIKNTAFTLGTGFPIVTAREQDAFINISLEAGQFGIKDVLSENYLKLTLGFTLNDNTWFFKRKFN